MLIEPRYQHAVRSRSLLGARLLIIVFESSKLDGIRVTDNIGLSFVQGCLLVALGRGELIVVVTELKVTIAVHVFPFIHNMGKTGLF